MTKTWRLIDTGLQPAAQNIALDRALLEAERWTESFCLIEVRLAKLDRSPALDRLASRLAKRL